MFPHLSTNIPHDFISEFLSPLVSSPSSSLTISTCFHLVSWTSYTDLTFLLPQYSHPFSLLLCDSSSFLQSLNFGESENSGPGHLLLWICTYRFGNITQSHKFKYYVPVDNYKTAMSHPGLFSQLRVHLTKSLLDISDWTSIRHFKFWCPKLSSKFTSPVDLFHLSWWLLLQTLHLCRWWQHFILRCLKVKTQGKKKKKSLASFCCCLQMSIIYLKIIQREEGRARKWIEL